MKTQAVQIRLRHGESKQGAILRLLGCASFAQAVRVHKLEDSDNAWQALEAIAADTVHIERTLRRIRTRLWGAFAVKAGTTGLSAIGDN